VQGVSGLMADIAPTIEIRENVTCICLGSKFENLDEQILEAIRSVVLETAAAADPPLVVIDMQYTRFFGSSFIEVLFRIWNRVNSLPGGRFSISSLSPYCREVLEVTHLDKLWELHSSLDEAVAALKP
jgi:anti-sigma B factor antagonist